MLKGLNLVPFMGVLKIGGEKHGCLENSVKTSTGFHPAGGATVSDIRLMREVVGAAFGVKASGGVNSLQDALAFIEAGATRVASRSAVAIVDALRE